MYTHLQTQSEYYQLHVSVYRPIQCLATLGGPNIENIPESRVRTVYILNIQTEVIMTK